MTKLPTTVARDEALYAGGLFIQTFLDKRFTGEKWRETAIFFMAQFVLDANGEPCWNLKWFIAPMLLHLGLSTVAMSL